MMSPVDHRLKQIDLDPPSRWNPTELDHWFHVFGCLSPIERWWVGYPPTGNITLEDFDRMMDTYAKNAYSYFFREDTEWGFEEILDYLETHVFPNLDV